MTNSVRQRGEKPIRVGVVGVGRGESFARGANEMVGWTNFHFANAIRSGEPPYLDVYRSVDMSSVGILAWKSALQDGLPFDVPDFRDPSSRALGENDHWSPWPEDAGPGQPPPSIEGLRQPSAEGAAFAREVWREIGYEEEGDG